MRITDLAIQSTVPHPDHGNSFENPVLHYILEDLPYPLNAINDEEIVVWPIRNSARPNDDHRTTTNPAKLTNTLPNVIDTCRSDLENSFQAKKNSAEIESALRSMKTNLAMLILFFGTCLIFALPTVQMKLIIGISYQSILKFVLPTVTMISNFGPIRDVVILYLQNLKPSQE